jgi:mRNA-degrading endonuclease RelE of RelBE toxin-antitoxin system
MTSTLKWKVSLTKSVEKNLKSLPRKVRDSLVTLIREIELYGPVRGNWKNYGKLSPNTHHCHIKGGNPTYVAIWEVVNKQIKIIEVIYAGTHERAPY